jgi:hypothetical protein
MSPREAKMDGQSDVWARAERVVREEAKRYGFKPPGEPTLQPRRPEHRGWVGTSEHPGYYLNIGGELRAYRGHALGSHTPSDPTSAAHIWSGMERTSPHEAVVIRRTIFPFESERHFAFNAADGWPMKAFLTSEGRTFFGPDMDRIQT